ncbi:hypothetical protein CLIB1423_33S00364 [[Candida] railenensis]|uniref:Uncharacterized protein n=1 Tax=[Candida] railenensis TaxID=45579 RepID=A0A9P0QWT7_9ASCO|nr:hypothetical protein CLIB1423_33S00364 [[Candida] railenensis]
MVIISVLSDDNKRRKHPREDDVDLEYDFDKRLKLTSESEEMEDAASETQEGPRRQNESNTKYSLNPSLKLKYSITKPNIYRESNSSSNVGSLGSSLSGPEVSDFIANKLYSHFYTIYLSKAALIKWYNSRWMIVYHFQKWVLRLFNRFYRKYIKKIGGSNKIKLFSEFNSILDMIGSSHINFQWSDLMRILTEENYLENVRLRKRAKARDDKKQLQSNQDGEIIEDHSYNYWDRLKGIDKDVNMFDVDMLKGGDTDNKFEELLDSDMEIE